MIRLLALALAISAPMPALALSCLAPDVLRSYAQFDAAKEEYVVVHGRLTLDMSELPKGMMGDQRPPRMTKLSAALKGKSLNDSGFTVPFDRQLTLEVTCLSQWCGQVQNGEDILAFVRKDADGYAMRVSPCGGTAFATPKPAMLKQVTQCVTKQNCTGD